MQANNATISPEDLVQASKTIAQAMNDSGQSYVRIADAGLELANTGLRGAAGNSLANKLSELRQQGLAQSERSVHVAQNMTAYGNNLGELSAQSAATFGSF